MFKKVIKEPLVHFLLAGFMLFVYSKSCSRGSILEHTITVDKEAMLNYMQFQSKAFNRAVFEEKFDQFSEKERQQLIQTYIRDEVLYKEAVKLGLDQNDFVIKRRVIQKMEFILNDFDESNVLISEDSIQAYYSKHSERYFQQAHYTFTHIFFKKNSRYDAMKRAVLFMQKEQNKSLSTAESLAHGDRFLYHRNYAEKTIQFLESQFGDDFTEALKELEVNKNKWQGPILSEHGYHLVKLIDASTSKLTDLKEIHSTVKADYLVYLKQQHKKDQINQLVKSYNINISL